jgi:hypothetical protein
VGGAVPPLHSCPIIIMVVTVIVILGLDSTLVLKHDV